MKKLFTASTVTMIVCATVTLTAVITNGVVNYENVALAAIGGYYGYLRGREDE